MISLSAAAGIALIELGLALTPGPNMMYLVSRSISQGWRAGMMSLSGTAVGFVVYMVMANLGLAAVFLVVPWLFITLKIAGAVYLLWLAYKTLRPGGKSLQRKPTWMRWQKWVTGTLLGAIGVKLAIDAPAPAVAP